MRRLMRFPIWPLAALALALAAAPILAAWWRAAPLPPPDPTGWTLPPGLTGWVSPDTLVVDLRDRTPPAEAQALARRFGASLTPLDVAGSPAGLHRFALAPEALPATLAALRRDPRVEAADREHYYVATWKPNDPRYAEQWNFQMIGAEQAWDRARGRDVIVAVIDTGVAFEQDERCYHARDFRQTRFVRGYDFIHRDEHPNDDHGHGTHVAGTIAESTHNGEGVAGLAFEAKVMPIKVLTKEGFGRTGEIAAGIRWAVDHGAEILNLSLGGPLPDQVLAAACRYAHRKGALIVCAAGNTGRSVGYPAAFPECLAISAVGPNGEITRYSSRGKPIFLAAPGGDTSASPQGGVLQNTVYQGRDDYYAFQGTSMAAPHVAAAAALVRSQGVRDPAAIRRLLQQSARPKSPKEHYGAGLLDAGAAVKLAAERQAHRRSRLLLALAPLALAGLLSLALRPAGAALLPSAAGLALGLLGPDLLAGAWSEGSRWNLLGHSALLPAALLVGVEPGRLRRCLGALALGVAIHLGLDAAHHGAPIPTEATVTPWLAVNAALSLILAVRTAAPRAS